MKFKKTNNPDVVEIVNDDDNTIMKNTESMIGAIDEMVDDIKNLSKEIDEEHKRRMQTIDVKYKIFWKKFIKGYAIASLTLFGGVLLRKLFKKIRRK